MSMGAIKNYADAPRSGTSLLVVLIVAILVLGFVACESRESKPLSDGKVDSSSPPIPLNLRTGGELIAFFVDPQTRERLAWGPYVAARPFHEGIAIVATQNGYGAISLSGEFVIPPSLGGMTSFIGEVAGASPANESTYGLMDRDGNWVHDPRWEAIVTELLPPVEAPGPPILVRNSEGYRYIDLRGKPIITETYPEALPFSSGLAPVGVSGEGGRVMWGFIDGRGDFVIDPVYDAAWPHTDGLAQVYDGAAWGYVDASGDMVIEPRFESTSYFTSGRAFVMPASRRYARLIDVEGAFVGTLSYKRWGLFSSGIAPVMLRDANNWIYIDAEGNHAFEGEFDYAGPFFRGYAVVRRGDTVGVLDQAGEWIWSMKTHLTPY